MYKLIAKVRLLKRVRQKTEVAAWAMAALLVLAAQPAQAQNTYRGSTDIHTGTIALVPGQTVSIIVPSFYFAADGSVRFFKSSSLKVYDREGHAVTERESGLIYSGESGGMNELGHVFTLSYVDLQVEGEPRTGRKEVTLEVQSISFPTQEPIEDGAVMPPTVELIDDADGKTVLVLSLMARPAQVQANAGGGLQLEMSRSLRDGLYSHSSPTAGQTVRIRLEAADASTTSVNKPCQTGARVRAFSASTGALVWSGELTLLTPGLNTIDINRDELAEVGERGTGRLPLWIELAIEPCFGSEPGAEECGQCVVAPPVFEVIDNASGKTTVRGVMWGPVRESMETMKKAWKDASTTPF
jgi:hypothetical protein